MVDAFNIMQDRITRARLAGDPPDVTISPRLGHVGWFDFHRAQEAIEAGAARRRARARRDRRGSRRASAATGVGDAGRAIITVVAQAVWM